MTNLREITSLINKIAGAVKSSEKLPLPVLAAKARREAGARPNDIPLVNASALLTKMASSQTFISRDELSEFVNTMGATHSKLASVFEDELGNPAVAKTSVFERENEGTTLDMDYQRLADPLLSNALAGAFEADPTDTLYTPEDGQRAGRAVQATLAGIGVEPSSIEVFAGRNDIIIIKASHETPKGVATALIPVEVVASRAKLPELFLSRAGFQDISKSEYINHLTDVVGKAFRVDGAALLDTLHQVKSGSKEPVSDVEMAAIKIASEGGQSILASSSVLYQELDPAMTEDVQVKTAAVTEESTFAESLGKPEGIANFIHSSQVVEAGRSSITNKLAGMGYRNVQVKVSEVQDDKISYSVALGTGTGLEVPIEVQGQRVGVPKIVFADEFVTSFTKDSIDEIVKSQSGGNRKALATANPCYDLKPTELLDIVKEAVHEGNLIRAEEAINVLGEVDPHAQKVAIAHMMMAISETGANPAEDMEAMQAIASEPVHDTPRFMTAQVLFPEGA